VADYLTDEEQLDRLKNWWQENGTSMVVAAVLAVGGIAGWRWYDSAQVTQMQAASEAYESFLAATGDARTEMAARLDAEFGETSYATFALLHQARGAAESGEGNAWRPNLEAMAGVVHRFPDLTFDLAVALPCITTDIDPNGGLYQSQLEAARKNGEVRADVDIDLVARHLVGQQWGVVLLWMMGMIPVEDNGRERQRSEIMTLIAIATDKTRKRLQARLAELDRN